MSEKTFFKDGASIVLLLVCMPLMMLMILILVLSGVPLVKADHTEYPPEA